MRYCYHNIVYQKSGAIHGLLCDPVKHNGKCVRGRGSQLVKFEDGVIAVVVSRALRLRSKCESHRPPALPNMIPDMVWLPVKDGDPRAFDIFRRHYSFRPYADGRRRHGYRNRFLILGPGEKMLLITQQCDALFAWRKFRDKSGQTGVNCAIFRNEGDILSSTLILLAEKLAWQRWPGERLYTYVDGLKIPSVNPGYCFKMAGWSWCGRTKVNGLTILEKRPPTPPPERV